MHLPAISGANIFIQGTGSTQSRLPCSDSIDIFLINYYKLLKIVIISEILDVISSFYMRICMTLMPFTVGL